MNKFTTYSTAILVFSALIINSTQQNLRAEDLEQQMKSKYEPDDKFIQSRKKLCDSLWEDKNKLVAFKYKVPDLDRIGNTRFKFFDRNLYVIIHKNKKTFNLIRYGNYPPTKETLGPGQKQGFICSFVNSAFSGEKFTKRDPDMKDLRWWYISRKGDLSVQKPLQFNKVYKFKEPEKTFYSDGSFSFKPNAFDAHHDMALKKMQIKFDEETGRITIFAERWNSSKGIQKCTMRPESTKELCFSFSDYK